MTTSPTNQRGSDGKFWRHLIAQAERTAAPGFDPTCVLCEFGEEPGHEH
jgi:hypothetical protein